MSLMGEHSSRRTRAPWEGSSQAGTPAGDSASCRGPAKLAGYQRSTLPGGSAKAQRGGTGQGCPARLSGLYQQVLSKTWGDPGSQNKYHGAEAAPKPGRRRLTPQESQRPQRGHRAARTAMQVGVMPRWRSEIRGGGGGEGPGQPRVQ